jgi:ferredoxin
VRRILCFLGRHDWRRKSYRRFGALLHYGDCYTHCYVYRRCTRCGTCMRSSYTKRVTVLRDEPDPPIGRFIKIRWHIDGRPRRIAPGEYEWTEHDAEMCKEALLPAGRTLCRDAFRQAHVGSEPPLYDEYGM